MGEIIAPLIFKNEIYYRDELTSFLYIYTSPLRKTCWTTLEIGGDIYSS